MEHLKGNQMKRDIKQRLAEARKSEVHNEEDSDTETEQDTGDQQGAFNKFNDPYKFW